LLFHPFPEKRNNYAKTSHCGRSGSRRYSGDGSPNPGAPVAGANSFTEGQAKSRIEARGFSNVAGLNKDADGVWRGTATQGGKSVKVSVDFQGNVVSQ
jgi:putative membrane protein